MNKYRETVKQISVFTPKGQKQVQEIYRLHMAAGKAT